MRTVRLPVEDPYTARLREQAYAFFVAFVAMSATLVAALVIESFL